MEQKKTLWIIAAVGAFLLVVLGAACILYSPAVRPCSPVASVAPVEKKQAPDKGWTNPDAVTAPGTIQAPNDMVVVADNATVYSSNVTLADGPQGTTIDLNALKRELYQETPAAAQPQNINITVNIPETTKETTYITTTPEYKPEVANAAPAPATPVEPKPAAVKPVEEKKVAKAAPAATPAKAKTPAASTPAPAAKQEAPKVTQFWVQVAAYSNKKGAEGARSVLDENKIPADIFTFRDNKDRLFYRVRVGPYTTKSEAEYWRSKIIKIDDFAKAESFVTSTTN